MDKKNPSKELEKLTSEFSKIAFKYNIIDAERSKVYSSFAEACANYVCNGGDIKDAVETLYTGGYIPSRRENSLFYKECVNHLMYTGSKLSKYSLFHNLDTLQKINEINTMLLQAKKSIEDNLDEALRVSVTPVSGYAQATITFVDNDGRSGRAITIDMDEKPLKLLQKMYSDVALFHKEYGYDQKYNINLKAALDAELVHKVFIDTERMPSAEKLEIIKEIFKDASPELKERFCNLYLSDYNKDLRQFLQEESLKIAQDRNVSVKPELSPKKNPNIDI